MTPTADSQKLVRCNVANRYKEISVRLIEIDTFKLWSYLMTHKHGMQISNPVLCLWVSEAEYTANPALFEHSGEVEKVDRLLLDLFDPETHFSHQIIRYCRSSESAQLAEILKSHIPERLREEPCCTVETLAGCIVRQWSKPGDQPLLFGLNA